MGSVSSRTVWASSILSLQVGGHQVGQVAGVLDGLQDGQQVRGHDAL